MARLKLREGWMTFLLLAAVVLTVTGAIQRADWTDDLAILTPIALGGLVLGLALAKWRRLPSVVAHLIALLVGAAFIINRMQVTEGLLPLARENHTWLGALNFLIERGRAWYAATGTEQYADDFYLFVLGLAALIWLVAYASTWMVFRARWIWPALLLPAVVLLVNLGYAPANVSNYLVLFVICALLLVARFHIAEREEDWRHGGVSFPESLGWRALWVGVIVVVLTVGFGWGAPFSVSGTPLNAVFGHAQILERDEAIPRSRRSNVSVIRRSAEHLSGLIDGLLEISRIEAGRLRLQRDEVRLDAFLDQIVDMFRFQAEAKGLAFRFERPDRLPEVVATDEKRLRQILVNLLSNAIKFTETGIVTLRIGYRSQIATLSVEDTGPGIPAEDIDRIFEPFERGSGAAVKTAPGTGLGLTITKMLAQLMGGDLSVTSVPGVGSRFHVRLMLAAIDRPMPAPPPARVVGYEGRRRTVLVADDDEDHRDLVRQILEPIGFIVLAVPDGPSCLALTADIRPDLFLLDISMPAMTGWELAARLREGGHDAPIVMLSANLGEMQPERAEDAMHDGALPKPFAIGQLLDRVKALLRLDWIDESTAAPKPAAPAPLRSPGADHVRELLDLGQIGYVRGIEAKLAALEAEADNQAFVAEMRIHLRNFDLDRYQAVLEAIDDDPSPGPWPEGMAAREATTLDG